jgi:hypothetical protein
MGGVPQPGPRRNLSRPGHDKGPGSAADQGPRVVPPLGLEPRTCGLRDPFRLCRLVPAHALTCGSVGSLVHVVLLSPASGGELDTWIST